MSQAGIQELLNNPPKAKVADPAFAGRDWKSIKVQEIIDAMKVRFVELDTSIEKATEVCCPPPKINQE